jgi:5'-AMP-activated protein kinase catalytic alpha subunit
MEHANGGELYDRIVKYERISETEACHIFYQLICAIEYLDTIGVAHRDIKPENILLDENNDIKLIDFGLGTLYKADDLLKTACGSPCYAAPEMVARKKYNGTMVDIWSSGVTLFAMLCGYLPFDDDDLGTLYAKILKGEYEISVKLSAEAEDLLSKLLVKDPKDRLKRIILG